MPDVNGDGLSGTEGDCDSEGKRGEADSPEGLAEGRLVFITGSAGNGPVGGALIGVLDGRGSVVAMMAAGGCFWLVRRTKDVALGTYALP